MRVCGARAIDHIVTDAALPAVRAAIEEAGIEVTRRMKLTIVGGGGFRVPLVYGALLAKAERLGLEEVVLHDIDADRLARIAAVLDGLADEHGARLPFRTTTDLDDAVEGTDYVFCAIRVGPARGPRRRRERPARARRARPGDDRAGRDLLRAAHDPGDGRARARRWRPARPAPG